MKSFDTDKNGIVTGFAYHDGELFGLVMDGAGSVHLAVSSSDGVRRLLTLRDVAALRVDEWRQGNVILNIRWVTKAMVFADAEMTDLVVSRLGIKAAQFDDGCHLFWLESSYGAVIAAVCTGFQVSDAGVTLGCNREHG